MNKKKIFRWLVFIAAWLMVACGPPRLINEYKEGGYYPQEFKTNLAFLALEWAERQPYIVASGSLADRERGIFYTAKHFTDEFGTFGPDYCKVFFNGKVYTARVVKVPPIRDAALIRIDSFFSSRDFPELLLVAKERPKVGDRVFIKGIHPHPHGIRALNEADGFPDRVIDIFRTYYGKVQRDLTKESQVVIDELEGIVVKPDPAAIIKDDKLSDEIKSILLQHENESYIKVKMARDHRFSFGGLSGGVAANDRGEVFGVITTQNPFRFERDESSFFFVQNHSQEGGTVKRVFDTIYVTPNEDIKELLKFVE
ncbi:MAG: hypothetical protein A3B86_02450 [Candidatus Yanofskybacteria bacterium RIFCSPHIGHO2_02_FULL_38_22b]|uniref:Uncharacterized protein n=1 Tax=Candidatus Yanofskybacteria bacterium RIFCSPHIGHO2_02_FULL_38_22b TaxID=1802673 RepID=A0A1F8F3F3_9BACT|nr:MAG: hypothetical protein A3B86_02450 [Candidatus Yanofskybacteria bacterium RIFCSPHIGHO2_02_FULL_38_22b]OGN20307.1 MAG: hypothetical protein A2910_03285 [Candidatus Yanofskybacteria bacterium RIFCSPLOWO2_01_FULL_39_28]